MIQSRMRWWCRTVLVVLVVGVLLVAGAAPTYAQSEAASSGRGDWQAHTSMRQVRALTVSPGAIWAATSGGVFRYVADSGEVTRLTAADGLHSVQTTAIAYDARREAVWIGYGDGVLDRVDVASGAIRTFRDIERSSRFADRGINRLHVHGDSVLVATDFGLVVFDPRSGLEEVRDSYTQLGTLPPATPIFDVRVAPVPDGTNGLWVAANRGLAHASLTSINLKDPGAWSVESAGLPDPQVYAVAFFEGRIYAGTERGFARRLEGGTYEGFATVDAVADLAVIDGQLIGAARFGLVVVEASGAARSLKNGPDPRPLAVAEGPDGAVWIGDAEAGLVRAAVPGAGADYETGDYVTPPGPYDGLFTSLEVDAQGTLWAGGAAGTGFYRRAAEGTWTSYTRHLVPELAERGSYLRIHIAPDGTAWAGSEGRGLASVSPDGSLAIYDHQNSSLLPATGTSSFVIVGGIESDAAGYLWVTTRGSAQSLHVRAPDGAWAAVTPTACEREPASATYGAILIDTYGQKWIIVRDENRFETVLGLIVLDTGADPADRSDDVCQFFGQQGAGGQGLPSSTVTALAEDRDGLVWVGTDDGPAYYINNGITAADARAQAIWPQWNDRSEGTWVLEGLVINDIEVDPANRLWVATTEGAYLVQQVGNGYEKVAHFTAETTPLFSNVILAIAVDPQTGTAYFATDRGLVSYQGDAVQSAAEAGELFVFPNPARVGAGGDARICIQGLVDQTEVRILTPSGALVRRFEGRGGQVCWDARDEAGAPVPSGVYLIAAVGVNGEGNAYGKAVVIR